MEGRNLGLRAAIGWMMEEGYVGMYYRYSTHIFLELIEERLEKLEIYLL